VKPIRYQLRWAVVSLLFTPIGYPINDVLELLGAPGYVRTLVSVVLGAVVGWTVASVMLRRAREEQDDD
jgi:mannitol-specific phosphotransferase system IIBC component